MTTRALIVNLGPDDLKIVGPANSQNVQPGQYAETYTWDTNEITITEEKRKHDHGELLEHSRE